MENNNPTIPPPPQGYSNPNPYQQAPGGYQQQGGHFGGQIDHPSAGSAQVCGIIGLILFFNLIGIILNIVALVKGSAVVNDYKQNPGRYTEASYRKGKGGRTCGIVGLSLFGGGLVIFILIAMIASM